MLGSQRWCPSADGMGTPEVAKGHATTSLAHIFLDCFRLLRPSGLTSASESVVSASMALNHISNNFGVKSSAYGRAVIVMSFMSFLWEAIGMTYVSGPPRFEATE